MLRKLLVLAVTILAAPLQVQAKTSISLEHIGRYSTGYFDEGGAEIPAYDARTRRAFVVNLKDKSIDVLDLRNPATPVKVGAIDMTLYGDSANSVAVHNGKLAVAIQAAVKTDPGVLAVFDTASLKLLHRFPTGALPDMVTFGPRGDTLVTANEGEPNDDYSIDPEGSLTVVNLRGRKPVVRQVSFSGFNAPEQRAELIAKGVRLFGPNASTAQDLEPEYVAIDDSGLRAYVTLQENNAIATVDLLRATVLDITALGTKDHSLPGNGLDPSDRDGPKKTALAQIGLWPLKGFYMPDSIHAYKVRQKGRLLQRTYLVTANEGDAREWGSFVDAVRVKDLRLDPTAFPNAAELQADGMLGRLNVTRYSGDTDGDGDHDVLHPFGARSFSIWTSAGDLVFDSGDFIEQKVLEMFPAYFNASHTSNDPDTRSDDKGPEPEGMALGEIGGRQYLFLGLERVGGVMVFDISQPLAPTFIQYLNPRDFSKDPEEQLAEAGDLGPEGLVFIPASESPNRQALLLVSNEVSGSTSVYRIKLQ